MLQYLFATPNSLKTRQTENPPLKTRQTENRCKTAFVHFGSLIL